MTSHLVLTIFYSAIFEVLKICRLHFTFNLKSSQQTERHILAKFWNFLSLNITIYQWFIYFFYHFQLCSNVIYSNVGYLYLSAKECPCQQPSRSSLQAVNFSDSFFDHILYLDFHFVKVFSEEIQIFRLPNEQTNTNKATNKLGFIFGTLMSWTLYLWSNISSSMVNHIVPKHPAKRKKSKSVISTFTTHISN